MWRRFICSIARKTKRPALVGEIEPIQAELQVGAMTNRARTPTKRRWPRIAGGAILRARLIEGPIERSQEELWFQCRMRVLTTQIIDAVTFSTSKDRKCAMGNDEGLDCWPRIGGRGRSEVGRGGEKKQFGSPRSEGESNAFQG